MACNRPYSSPIYILDNDSLLNIFYLYRPVILADDENDDDRILEGGEWGRERWWHKLAHVCRRWRYLILGSASHLGLCLVCTYGTPVADMLAHSPPLPLVIDYVDDYINDNHDYRHYIYAKYEEGIILALQFCDRVHRLRLRMPFQNLEKFITHHGFRRGIFDTGLLVYRGPNQDQWKLHGFQYELHASQVISSTASMAPCVG